MFDPLNLLLLGAAIFIFWRLYLALGTRTGQERPPFDPYTRPKDDSAAPKPAQEKAAEPAPPLGLPDPQDAPQPVWKGFAAEGSTAAAGLLAIVAADTAFKPKAFIDGAKLAYEMIIEAFAKGDKAALKPLLTREVFDGFAKAIDKRNADKLRMETRFVGIKKCEIAEAAVAGNRAAITLRIVSEMISATRDAANQVVEGDPNEVKEITDVWTFERDTASRDPNWKLSGTDDES